MYADREMGGFAGGRVIEVTKIGATPLVSPWSPSKAATRPAPTSTKESATDRSTPSAVVIDLAQARRSSHAARVQENPSDEDQDGLTLKDWAVFGYLVAATAFYPALAWSLSHF